MPDPELDHLLRPLRDLDGVEDPAASQRRVIARLDRSLAGDRSLRAGFRNARRAVLVIAAGAGALGGVAATTAVAIAADGSRQASPAAAASPRSTANPDRLSYAAVERSTQRPSARVRTLLRVTARGLSGIDVNDARGIRASDGTQAWVVTGGGHTCFGAQNADGTGYSCTSNARARVGALSTADASDDGTIRAIYLVPDDITSLRAGGRTFTPEGNLVIARYREGDHVQVTANDHTVTTLG